ncbi:MAG: DUF1223 domain-containing protein [Acidobacteria bacterium]|nr:DUF1223 domain-containing protein [Acidobacteriota bacterium]
MKLTTGLMISLLGLFLLTVIVGVRLSSARSSVSLPTAEGIGEATEITANPTAEPAPVLVELFTSEGCSSCPPADQVLSRLDGERSIPGANVIVLSQHVDYWNRLGWRDPYSAAEFSERQGSYAAAFGRDGVYTPQMVIDGRLEFVGSNITKAREAIAQAARLPKAKVQIELAPKAEASQSGAIQLMVRVEDIQTISAGDTAEVWLAITENDLNSSVASGENAGRNLRHTAVVRQLKNIGSTSVTKGAASFTATPVINIPDDWRRDKLRAVVFVQERVSRHVLGAAMVGLAK